MSRIARWRRFEARTGNQAVLVETGETFEALATQGGAGTGVGLRPAPAVADVADEPPRNGRLLSVKRPGACTAEVRGSNPLSSTTSLASDGEIETAAKASASFASASDSSHRVARDSDGGTLSDCQTDYLGISVTLRARGVRRDQPQSPLGRPRGGLPFASRRWDGRSDPRAVVRCEQIVLSQR